MEDRKNVRGIPLGVVAGFSAVILMSGGAAAWWTWQSLSPQTAVPEFSEGQTREGGLDSSSKTSVGGTGDRTQQPSNSTDKPALEQTGKIYWLKDVDGHLKLVPQDIALPETDSSEEKLKAALNLLMRGPTEADSKEATTIPSDS